MPREYEDDDDQPIEDPASDHEDDDEDSERRLAEAVGSDDDEESDEGSDEELGDRGKRALDRMKDERKRLRAEMREMAEKVKKYEDSQKSETQRLSDDATSYKTRAEQAEQKMLRLEVAMEKGLTAKQAARLAGDSKEELEEDADELLALFKKDQREQRPASSKPKEQLRGGGDPEEEPEETNPSKLASTIPRNRFS